MKALSPAINDSGTAKYVIAQLISLLSHWSEKPGSEQLYYLNVSMPMINEEELIAVCFDSLIPLMKNDLQLIEFFINSIVSLERINSVYWNLPIKKRLNFLLSQIPDGINSEDLRQLVRSFLTK